jgi:cyanophycin synthetase
VGSEPKPSLPEILLEAIVAVENAVAARMHRLDLVEHASVALTDKLVELRWSSQSPALSKRIAAAAIAGVNEILRGTPSRPAIPTAGSFQALFSDLEKTAISRRLTTTVSVIREAAKARGIPVAYIGGSYLRLGQGKYQSYFRGSVTSKTSHAASQMSIDKRLATKALRLQRLPVPRHVKVTSLEAAIAASAEIGFPLVLKPMKGHGGAGVSVVRTPSEMAASYRLAAKAGSGVLLEQFIEGKAFRLLVIQNKVVAALRIEPPAVTGDGIHTIGELVRELNRDPFRDGFRLIQLELDDALARHLKKSGASFDTILKPGKTLALRNVANVSQGGYAVDVTDEVHPDNADVAVRAASVIGLDVAGIDFLTPDIGRSYKKAGGAIIEVNGRPGLGMHFWPREGKQRDVGGAIVDLMYPPGTRASMDTAMVIGTRRTAVIARDLDALLRDMGRSVGLSIRGRVFAGGNRRELEGRKPVGALRILLREPDADCLVTTAAPAGIVSRGLLVRNADVIAVTAPEKDADLAELRQALDVAVAASPSRFVIGVDHPLAGYIVERLGVAGVTLVSRLGLSRAIRNHLKQGGNAVVARWIGGRRHIEIHEHGQLVASLPVTGEPQAEKGPARDHSTAVNSTGPRSQQVEPRLFAVAMGLALGQSKDAMTKALARAPLSVL